MLNSEGVTQSNEDFVISHRDKILSNFIHLRFKKTSEQEHFLLAQGTMEIRRSETAFIKKEYTTYQILFHLSVEDYESIKNVIPAIRKNLRLKAKTIFQWFPQCEVEDIKVLAVQASTSQASEDL